MQGDGYVGRLGPITSFPEVLRGLTSIWGPGDLDVDYGAAYALPADERAEVRARMDTYGY